MNTIKRFGILWLITGITLSFTACSSDDDEPIVEPEDEVILTPIPSNAEPGMIYAISHDKKNDTCTFQAFFGKTRLEELGDAYIGARIHMKAYDNMGNVIVDYLLHASDTPEESLYESAMMDTFTIPCFLCERIRSFETTMYDGEDAFNPPVEHVYSWSSPHQNY